jgi:hypothetical protein
MLIAMMEPAERLGLGSRALNLWADPYRRGAFRPPLPSGSWSEADDLLRAAMKSDRSARGILADLLELSNRTFDPLADPLATDFGAHRWLSADREEAYSDWLGWILEQIGDAERVLRLLGVREKETIRMCASEKPAIRMQSGSNSRNTPDGFRRDPNKRAAILPQWISASLTVRLRSSHCLGANRRFE